MLREAGFERVDAYRYNSASLRVRIIDSRFENLSREERDAIAEPALERLPPNTKSDIVNLVLVSPSELTSPGNSFRDAMLNAEFDNPSPSML